MQGCCCVVAEPKQMCETRLQARRRREEELVCQQKDVQDGAVAHLDTPTVEVEPVDVEQDDSELEQPADDEGDVSSLPATAEGQNQDIPLPSLDNEQRELLIANTLSDDSLAALKKHADEGLLGHSWEKGLLMQEFEHENLGMLKRIVVPSEFRPLILDLAHKHGGIAKMRLLLAHGQVFTEMLSFLCRLSEE